MTTPQRRKDSNKNNTQKILIGFFALILWAGLVGGGFYFAKDYFDNTVNEVQETNAMHIQSIEDKLNSIESDIEEVETAVAQADEKISDSESTRRELTEKIQELDSQLNELKKSLEILRESGDEEY